MDFVQVGDELQRHHNDMARFVVESGSVDIPFPSNFDSSQFTLAAFDNFDHDEVTLSECCLKTMTVLKVEKPRISATNTKHGSKTFECELKCQQLKQFFKPIKNKPI